MRKKVIGTLLTGALALMLAVGGGNLTAHAEGETVGETVLDEQMDSVAVLELQYTYDAAAKTATITGNQSFNFDAWMRKPSVLPADTERVVIKDATLSGNLACLFADLENLESVEFENAKLTHITVMEYMFSGCKNLRSIDLGCFDTFSCYTMSALFKGCSSLENIYHLQGLDLRNCNYFDEMFSGCSSLEVIYFTQERPFGGKAYTRDMFSGTSAEIIIPYSKNITRLCADTFFDLTAESRVVIPDTITYIDDRGIGYRYVIDPNTGERTEEHEKIPGFIIYGSDPANEKAARYAERYQFDYETAAGSKFYVLAEEINTDVKVGETINVKATMICDYANYEKLVSYQWQKYVNGKWQNMSAASSTSNLLSVKATSGMNNLKVRCVLTDRMGRSAYSKEVPLTVRSDVSFTKQPPKTITATEYQTITLQVDAKGPDLIYSWKMEKVESNGLNKYNLGSGKTLEYPVRLVDDGAEIYCEVSTQNTEFPAQVIKSEATKLSVYQTIWIRSTSGYSAYALPGDKVTFSLTAEGDDLTYQWQKSTDKGVTWVNSVSEGANTPALTLTASEKFNDYRFRCVIKDPSGQTATAKFVLYILKITGQPVSTMAVNGKWTSFTVETLPGGDTTYQWQQSKDGKNWVNCIARFGEQSYHVVVDADMSSDGMKYRCVVTKGEKTVISEAATLTVCEPVNIKTSPKDRYVVEGNVAVFNVEAEGTNLKYQWQKSTDGGKTWVNSSSAGANTATLKVNAKREFDGYLYRCVVTGVDNSQTTRSVYLYVYSNSIIETQPADVTVMEGQTAKFQEVVTDYQRDLKYHWQKSTDGGKTWVNSSSEAKTLYWMTPRITENTLTMTAKASYNGLQFRCVAIAPDGTVISTSSAAKLTVKRALAITTQPASQTVKAGANATFKVAAVGEGLKYQWKKSTDGGKTWVNSSSTGCTTNTLSMTTKTGFNGLKFKCIVTDENGKTVESNVVTLTVTAATAVTTQPTSQTVKAGTNVTFKVAATGDSLKYQWQKSTDGGKTWVNSSSTGATTNTLTMTTKASYNGLKFRCKITDSSNTVTYSNTVTLTVQ